TAHRRAGVALFLKRRNVLSAAAQELCLVRALANGGADEAHLPAPARVYRHARDAEALNALRRYAEPFRALGLYLGLARRRRQAQPANLYQSLASPDFGMAARTSFFVRRMCLCKSFSAAVSSPRSIVSISSMCCISLSMPP